MKLVLSGFPPVASEYTFHEVFEEFLPLSDKIRISVGYVASEALAQLESVLRANDYRTLCLDLVIGMHKFEGFTKQQYKACLRLHEYLQQRGAGAARVCTAFPYHGKIYSFSKNGRPFAATVGSSNLAGLIDTHNVYEVDVLVDQQPVLDQVISFQDRLSLRAARNINEIPDLSLVEDRTRLFDNVSGVEEVPAGRLCEIKRKLVEPVFRIPIKPAEEAPKSNLNAFFGKGRENTRTGFVRPRHWYEAELIVPRTITETLGYPAKGENFIVITDDGWQFQCNVNGDGGKNFRSSENLQILGRWLKGRLEASGCLDVGEPVTADCLAAYGRTDFIVHATTEPGIWYIDFSRGEKDHGEMP